MKDNINTIRLKLSDKKLGYASLPEHPGKGTHGCVKYQICLKELIENYKGPVIYLDLDHDDTLIGIEIDGD